MAKVRNKATKAKADDGALWEERLRADPFPLPACLLEYLERITHERKVLTRRMAEIGQRLEDIGSRLAALSNDDRKAEVHELRAERQTLEVLQRRFGGALAALDAPPGPEFAKRSARAARREDTLDRWEREQREGLAFSIARYESAGDFREARLARVQWLLIRDEIAQTLH